MSRCLTRSTHGFTTSPISTAGSIASINSAVPNRFIDSFYDLITLIFHYHYQWNKHDERQRNEVAIREHLDLYRRTAQARDSSIVELACRAHLASAKLTLLRSTSG